MANWIHRILSLAIVIAYVALGARQDGGRGFWAVLYWSILPLACIWFADELGRYTGPWFLGPGITQQSPGCLLRLVAWGLLLLPIAVAVLNHISQVR